ETLGVLGRDAGTIELEQCLALESEPLLDLIAEAEQAHVLLPAPALGRFGFAHPLIGDVLYQRMLGADRIRSHRAIAAALERVWSQDLSSHFAELAYHCLQAPFPRETERAAAYSAQAGDRSLA